MSPIRIAAFVMVLGCLFAASPGFAEDPAGLIDTANLPKGNASVADMELEGQLRAYAAATRAVDVIVNNVSTVLSGDQRVLLATDAQLQALNQYRAFVAQMVKLKESAELVIANPPPVLRTPDECIEAKAVASTTAGTAAVMAAINSLLGVAALFKIDVDLKGMAVTLNDFAIVSLTLKALKEKGIAVIYPAAYYRLPTVSNEGDATRAYDEVFKLKPRLQNAGQNYSNRYDTLRDQVLQAKSFKPTAECKAAFTQLKQNVDNYAAGLAAVEKAIDDVGTALTKQDAQSGLTQLSSYLVSERIEQAVNAGTKAAPVLQIRVVAAGGSTQTRKNLFTTRISYGGGAVISYQLFSQDGSLLAADTISWNAGFLDERDFKAGQVQLH